MKYSNTKIPMFFPLIAIAVIILVYKKFVCLQTDNFHFEVTPSKTCQGGKYMVSSADPEQKAYCNKLFSTPEGLAEYSKYNCTTPGFNGAPLHFEYTSLSDDKWENQSCKNRSLQGPVPL